MIREVLSNKTKRQLLRKFHKEKKRDLPRVDTALKKHESNLITKDERCHSFLENVLRQTSDSDMLTENSSNDSLDRVINRKLKLLFEDDK